MSQRIRKTKTVAANNNNPSALPNKIANQAGRVCETAAWPAAAVTPIVRNVGGLFVAPCGLDDAGFNTVASGEDDFSPLFGSFIATFTE